LFNVVNLRNSNKFNNQATYDRLNVLYETEGEMLAAYGGRFDSQNRMYNLQYFNINEFTQNDLSSRSSKYAYNVMMPHYQLG
jgi:hypothetical protein